MYFYLKKGVAGSSTHQACTALQHNCVHNQGWGCIPTEFINKFGRNPETDLEIPNRATSWMDRANGQIKEITKEDSSKEEHELKITALKHSAARTVVVQATNAGPIFKGMTSSVKQGDQLNASISSQIYQYLKESLHDLSQP